MYDLRWQDVRELTGIQFSLLNVEPLIWLHVTVDYVLPLRLSVESNETEEFGQ